MFRKLGPLLPKTSSLTMKERLNEVVRPVLSDNCLQRSDSKHFLRMTSVLIAKVNQSPSSRIGERLRGNRIGSTGLRASERKSASERVSEREGFQRFLRGFERFLEVFRDFERFSEIFRGFERFFRGFQRFLRGFQRSSQRPSQRQISSQRLSVLLPLIVLPLELSPKEDGCFSSPTPRRFRQSAVQSNRLFLFLDGWSLKLPFLAARTATKPLRLKRQIEFRVTPCVSACFCLFLSVSICFRLFLSNTCRKLRGTPQRALSKPEWRSDSLLFFLHSRVPETEMQRRRGGVSESKFLQL